MTKKEVKYLCRAYQSREDIIEHWLTENEPETTPVIISIPEDTLLYGFKFNKHGQITINPIEAEVVQDIFRMHIFGLTNSTICEKLIFYKNALPVNKTAWTPDIVQSILCNERYAGYMFFTCEDLYVSHYISRAVISEKMYAAAQQIVNIKENSQSERMMRFAHAFRLNTSI